MVGVCDVWLDADDLAGAGRALCEEWCGGLAWGAGVGGGLQNIILDGLLCVKGSG